MIIRKASFTPWEESLIRKRYPSKYTFARLPTASSRPGAIRVVSDTARGAAVVFSDGADWRYADGEIVRTLPLILSARGQSNMAAIPPPTLGYSFLTQYLGADLLGFSDATLAFVPLVDGSANSRANADDLGVGAGPGGGQVMTLLMRRIADLTGQNVKLYASAYPGQGIDYFLPNSSTEAYFEDGSQHATLNNFDLLQSYYEIGGYPEWEFFCQGEADAGTAQSVYYPKLRTLFDALIANNPTMKMSIIGTIGDNTAGVNAAQRQLADEEPGVVFFRDHSDMFHNTAFYRGPAEAHYSTAAGYEEVAEREFAGMQGRTRPNVPAVQHIDDVLDWTHGYGYTRSIDSGDVVAWSDVIDVNSLTTSSPAAHVAADPVFGGRSALDFVAADSNRYVAANLPDASSATWTFFEVGQIDAIAAPVMSFELRDASAANRFGFQPFGQGGSPDLFYNTSSVDITGSPAFNNDPHSWCLVIDAANTIARLYIDGEPAGSVTISGAETILLGTLHVGSLSGASQFYDGRMLWRRVASGIAATAEQAKAMHAWAKVEFKLTV